MLISFDRTNFPIIAVEGLGIEIHLLPITKWQFERFLDESKVVKQTAYQEMLALNPAISFMNFNHDKIEQLFITGILPTEIWAFAQWLGEGFDIPTLEEWRAIHRALKKTPLPRYSLSEELVDGPAEKIIDQLIDQVHTQVMVDLTLMPRGLVEWVRQGENLVGVGAPRPQFHPNLWDSFSHEITPIDLSQRLPYFGFRLVRRGEWYLADRGNAKFIY